LVRCEIIARSFPQGQRTGGALVGVGAEFRDDESDPLRHPTRNERYVTAQAIELGDYDRATQ
jgi:hypothetical protein